MKGCLCTPVLKKMGELDDTEVIIRGFLRWTVNVRTGRPYRDVVSFWELGWGEVFSTCSRVDHI